ncbi:MAG: Uma2 family endonuclease [Planctomycetaceae bacterium]
MAAIVESKIDRLDASFNGALMSPEEFDAIERWDPAYEYELIRGVVIVNPIPSEGETDPNEELGMMLRAYQALHPHGRMLNKTLPEQYVYLPDGTRRKADRLIWAGIGRRPHPKKEMLTSVVEFVSRAARDRRRNYEEKRREYLAIGIKEYWVIDRFRRQMTVFRADSTEQTIGETEKFQTPLLPGFELPLAQLLALSDEWEDTEL